MNESTVENTSATEKRRVTAQAAKAKEVSKSELPLFTPSVFQFVDYRVFLKSFFAFKKAKNASYSFTTFAMQAGLGASMRGYPKMVMEGARNLSPHSIRAFSDALALEAREAMYFENLVYFNQSKSGRDKDHYFQRLSISAEGSESDAFRLLRSQYTFFSKWYLVVIRELVALPNFKEDAAWIVAQLRGKITRAQAQESLEHLSRLSLIKRDAQGKWVQSHAALATTEESFHLMMHKFYLEMIERAKEALKEDPYEQRHCGYVTLSMNVAKLPELVQAISNFRNQVVRDFGVNAECPDSVVQLNIQLFQFTPLASGVKEKSDSLSKNSKEKIK